MPVRMLAMAIAVVVLGPELVPARSYGYSPTYCLKLCQPQIDECHRSCAQCKRLGDVCVGAPAECCTPATCVKDGNALNGPACFHACYEGYCYTGCSEEQSQSAEQACAQECQGTCGFPEDGSANGSGSGGNGNGPGVCERNCQDDIVTCCQIGGTCGGCDCPAPGGCP